ncbi:hypothetical protein KVG88_13630 [Pseudomonas sp. SWRI74]|uniref:Uncharacterized protein n=2 Tax=Pseudomonas azerbaijanoccidentalis TaxID=2842347 RepID=A0ABS6QRN8_9PSED|nr:hypothetical protein [Pseudomonas azerbaijanoccidentalis]
MSRARKSSEDPSLVDKITGGEPLMALEMQTLRRYHDTQKKQPAEVDRLRLEATVLLASVYEYQHQTLGGRKPQLH